MPSATNAWLSLTDQRLICRLRASAARTPVATISSVGATPSNRANLIALGNYYTPALARQEHVLLNYRSDGVGGGCILD